MSSIVLARLPISKTIPGAFDSSRKGINQRVGIPRRDDNAAAVLQDKPSDFPVLVGNNEEKLATGGSSV